MKIKSDQIVSGVIAGVALLISWAIPAYMYMHIQSSQAYIHHIAGEIASQATDERAAALTQQALVDTKIQRDTLDALAPKADGAAGFIDAVERAASNAGVVLEVGNVTSNPGEGLFNTLELNLKATGSFASVTRFLRLIETLPYASSVKDVVIGVGEKSGIWSLTGAISVPIHKQQ